MAHPSGPCTRCGVDYQPEELDFHLCCKCERDLIAVRVVGDNWAIKAKAATNLLEFAEMVYKEAQAVISLVKGGA